MQYKVSTLRKSKEYKVKTLFTPSRVVSFENNPTTYQVNRTPVNVTVNMQGGNDKHYEHRQDSALAVWDITHNLDKIPSVSVFDSAGDKWEVIPDFISSNRLTITFPAALTGVAYLN